MKNYLTAHALLRYPYNRDAANRERRVEPYSTIFFSSNPQPPQRYVRSWTPTSPIIGWGRVDATKNFNAPQLGQASFDIGSPIFSSNRRTRSFNSSISDGRPFSRFQMGIFSSSPNSSEIADMSAFPCTLTDHGILAPRLADRGLNVCRLNSGQVCLSLRDDYNVLAFNLSDEERLHLIGILQNPPAATEQATSR